MYGEHPRKSKNIWHTRGLEPDDSILSLSAGFARCRVNKTTFLQNVFENRSYIQVLDAFFDEETESVVRKWERDNILFRTTFFRCFFCLLKIL